MSESLSPESFISAVHQGKNDWWRYVLGVLLLMFMVIVPGSLVTGLAVIVVLFSRGQMGLSESTMLALLRERSVVGYVLNSIAPIFLVLGLVLTMRWLHRRRFTTLIVATGRVSFRRFLQGFLLWFGLTAVIAAIDYVQNPKNIVLSFDPAQWFPLLAVAIVLTPIQTAAEELFCRAYLMQGLSLFTQRRWLLVLLPSLLFAVAHFQNPEMARNQVLMALQYWTFGVFLAIVTLRDNRLELSLGIHAAQNLFVLLLMNTKDSVLPTPSVWTVQDPGDPVSSLVAFGVQAAICYGVLLGRSRSMGRS
jgi:uncharacterized protein